MTDITKNTTTLPSASPLTPPFDTSLDTIKAIDTTDIPAVVTTSVKLTGRMLNFTRLQIQGDDLDLIKTQLQKKLGKQQDSKLPVVVSCGSALDLPALWQLLWDIGLQPIGIITGEMNEQAKAQNIAIFPADGQRLNSVNTDKPAVQKVIATSSTPTAVINKPDLVTTSQSAFKVETEQAETQQPKTQQIETQQAESADTNTFAISNLATSLVEGDRICDQIVRSGQSINHVGGDLILTKGLNAGAEAITDYSLHIYGKAEGRLVAGATGDRNARIFCLRFNPSLVSVAGTYCLRENIPAEFLDKAVQVSYDPQQGLVFQLINL